MSAAAWPSTVSHRAQSSSIFYFPHTPSPHFHFPYPRRRIHIETSKVCHFSYNALSQPQKSEEEDEEHVIGDCLVFEEGAFDSNFFHNTKSSGDGNVRIRSKDNGVKSENLIPDEWLDVQKELNITKKERRKLAQQLDYCTRVEKRRKALMPINSVEYEEYKREKLQQLSPVVLDQPEPKYFKKIDENEKSQNRKTSGEETNGRATPRNPRLAVYRGGLEDISALFRSENYVGGSPDKAQAGARKLFSKEEKMLMNRRVPNVAVATSGKWHPIHSLVACGEFYLVNSLLKHNVDINSLDKDGLSALHKSILGKKQAIFNFLLRESANPFITDDNGNSLMHYAVRVASSQMVKILLLYNVDINAQNNDGWTALHVAVQCRRTDIVRLLLIKGADKTVKNRDGLTAVDLCLYSGRVLRTYELIKLLKRI